MYLEIISPEATLFQGEVNAVSVPGIEGSFQVLNNHAAIVSNLTVGEAKIEGNFVVADAFKSLFSKKGNDTIVTLTNGGTFEMSKNRAILFMD
jgi:F-type H+-transporting ATPase subunit epsilon